MSVANKKEVLDVDMCYMAMGISIGDSPEQVELKYQRLIEVCRQEARSPDPKVREHAKDNIVLFEKMYDRIKTSVTYQTTTKEYEKKSREKPPQAETVVIKNVLIHCPSCNALIGKSLKSCPACKADFRSKSERFIDKYLTKTSVAVFALLVMVGIIVCLGFYYQDQIETVVESLRK